MTFAIFGLYRDNQVPAIVTAEAREDALRQYHDRHPGMEGTTWRVLSLEELTELNSG